MPVTIHQVTAVLDMPDDYLGQGKRAGEIITASKTSTYVTVPSANLDAADEALATFQKLPRHPNARLPCALCGRHCNRSCSFSSRQPMPTPPMPILL